MWNSAAKDGLRGHRNMNIREADGVERQRGGKKKKEGSDEGRRQIIYG